MPKHSLRKLKIPLIISAYMTLTIYPFIKSPSKNTEHMYIRPSTR